MSHSQRYPADYDGILSGAPVINFAELHVAQFWGDLTMLEAGNIVPECKFDAATEAAIAACDELDGVADGVLEDPTRCEYDANDLIGTVADGCEPFTEIDAEVIRKIWERIDLTRKVAGEPEPILHSKSVDLHPAYSPDGRQIAFVSERSGSRQIWLSDSEGQNLRRLTNMGSIGGMVPRWSPDSQRITFSADEVGDNEIYVMDIDGGTPKRLTNHPSNDTGPLWAADGMWIQFWSNRSGEPSLWKISAESGTAVQDDGDRIGVEDSEGNWIYFLQNRELWRRLRKGGNSEKLTDPTLRGDLAVNSKGVFYVSGIGREGAVIFLEPETGRKLDLATVGLGAEAGLTTSPDSRYVIFQASPGVDNDDLMLVENFR